MNTLTQPIPDIGECRGQQDAKLAILIAAAGNHNLLMIGPPGEGKSMLAATLPGILPNLSVMESASLQSAYAASGLPIPNPGNPRPYRAVGPTASLGSLIGGGRSGESIFPGDLALAHCGILFIDELPQFDRAIIDALRQPLESGSVTITRGGSSVTWPSRVQLVAAMNPCPCGYYQPFSESNWSYADWVEGSLSKTLTSHPSMRMACSCSDADIERYQSKVSGPILDRIDLICWLYPLSPQERFSDAIPNQSLSFLSKVIRSQRIQRMRNAFQQLNSQLSSDSVFSKQNLLRFSGGDTESRARNGFPIHGSTYHGYPEFMLETAKPRYSTRRSVRLARVSRTVADLYDSPTINADHVRIASRFVSQSIGDMQ